MISRMPSTYLRGFINSISNHAPVLGKQFKLYIIVKDKLIGCFLELETNDGIERAMYCQI